jgi:hypothetical protein
MADRESVRVCPVVSIHIRLTWILLTFQRVSVPMRPAACGSIRPVHAVGAEGFIRRDQRVSQAVSQRGGRPRRSNVHTPPGFIRKFVGLYASCAVLTASRHRFDHSDQAE